MSISPEQAKAGRMLLDWSEMILAENAGVDVSMVTAFENGDGAASTEAIALIKNALEAAGVEFVERDEAEGPGVRLEKPNE